MCYSRSVTLQCQLVQPGAHLIKKVLFPKYPRTQHSRWLLKLKAPVCWQNFISFQGSNQIRWPEHSTHIIFNKVSQLGGASVPVWGFQCNSVPSYFQCEILPQTFWVLVVPKTSICVWYQFHNKFSAMPLSRCQVCWRTVWGHPLPIAPGQNKCMFTWLLEKYNTNGLPGHEYMVYNTPRKKLTFHL